MLKGSSGIFLLALAGVYLLFGCGARIVFLLSVRGRRVVGVAFLIDRDPAFFRLRKVGGETIFAALLFRCHGLSALT